ncbi:MAG: hypothetical protein S4CHLAM20_09290 [Chlamydiia bacterium]|nr:hypothetical protein [Chlamydiia bacterium]
MSEVNNRFNDAPPRWSLNSDYTCGSLNSDSISESLNSAYSYKDDSGVSPKSRTTPVFTSYMKDRPDGKSQIKAQKIIRNWWFALKSSMTKKVKSQKRLLERVSEASEHSLEERLERDVSPLDLLFKGVDDVETVRDSQSEESNPKPVIGGEIRARSGSRPETPFFVPISERLEKAEQERAAREKREICNCIQDLSALLKEGRKLDFERVVAEMRGDAFGRKVLKVIREERLFLNFLSMINIKSNTTSYRARSPSPVCCEYDISGRPVFIGRISGSHLPGLDSVRLYN